ncbi:MAG: ABC transporter ATP-binding protein [Burkholderiales bacterium]|nr:ABC transporter ATP-binding protein [Burkholderiales bacterium]
MAEAVLRLEHVRKRYGGLRVTDDVTLAVLPGEVHALIGPNGAGKTSLINQISGLVAPDEGRIVFAGTDITHARAHERARLGLARSFQITSVLAGFSVLDNVSLAVQAHTGSSWRFFGNAATEAALVEPAMQALAEVGLAARAEVAAAQLSHGEKRALELAMALAVGPKLLLLDEPMAGTGAEETAALVAVLERLRGRFAMLLVEHDMQAVFALADRVSVLIDGRVVASGAPDDVRSDPQVIAAYLGDETA